MSRVSWEQVRKGGREAGRRGATYARGNERERGTKRRSKEPSKDGYKTALQRGPQKSFTESLTKEPCKRGLQTQCSTKEVYKPNASPKRFTNPMHYQSGLQTQCLTFTVGLIGTPRNTVFKDTLLQVPGVAIDGRKGEIIPEPRQNLHVRRCG